jgi:norsolorinic acid ketoreductase
MVSVRSYVSVNFDMSSKTTVLITGANRGKSHAVKCSVTDISPSLSRHWEGIGESLPLRPNHVVIAAVRDPSHPTSQSLSTLAAGSGSSLIIVEYDATLDASPAEAVRTLQTRDSITAIDVVIANAARGEFSGSPLQAPLQGNRDDYNVNTVGPLAVFQATFPLLSAAVTNGSIPRFITVTSTVGSIGDMANYPSIATGYGASKASLNWITRRIHFDHPELIAFPIYPGYVCLAESISNVLIRSDQNTWVQSEMGNMGARLSGLSEAPVSIKDCADAVTSRIDNATREETSGKFVCYDDESPAW